MFRQAPPTPSGRPALRGLIAALLCLAVAGCSSAAPDAGDYLTRMTRMRAAKDAQFALPCCSDGDPVPDSRKAEFLPLAYFPIEDSYNVPALLTPSTDRTVFLMPTSSGQPRQERRAGTLAFTLHGTPMTLTAFVEADAPNMNRLFLPFSDVTTGKETYSAGRFLDLDRTPTGIYELDFNRAYTPYCYYNPTYECPYPPPENRLKIPIEAGERVKVQKVAPAFDADWEATVLRAIVFDFDGVIANSEPLHFRAYRDVLREERVHLNEADYYARYLGYDDLGAFAAVASDRGLTWPAAHLARLVARKATRMEVLEREGSVLFPGASAAIEEAAGVMPIAIASGALGAEIRRVLDRAKLTRHFTAIVAAEDTPASKPAPDPYVRAVALLSAVRGPLSAGECLAIEDSHWGIESARAAGLRTMAVAHTYQAGELGTADIVIPSMADFDLDALQRRFSP